MKNQKRIFELDGPIKFGKYSKLTVKQIYCGNSALPDEWICEVLRRNFLPSENGFKVLGQPYQHNFKIDFQGKYLTMSLKPDCQHLLKLNGFDLNHCNYWVEINNFLTECYYGIPQNDAKGSAAMYSQQYFEDRAREGMIDFNDILGEGFFSLECRYALRYGQPTYISWLIQNVEYFSLRPNDLDDLEDFEINSFLGIWVKKVNEHTFLPSTVFIKHKQKFSDYIKKYNEKKWAIFLSQQEDERSRNNYNESEVSASKYNYSDGYGGYVSDSFIDDVLDGEPEAYWNLD